MKKSLTALAVLGVFAGSAMAADVTLYGALDTGFEYFHKKTTQYDGSSEKSDTFDMQTGWDTGNRWGLKGSEDLGNGYKVSFKLESGFNGDDGTMGQSSRLFGREAGLTLSARSVLLPSAVSAALPRPAARMTCWATLNPSTAATAMCGALRLPIVMTTWLSTRPRVSLVCS